MPLHFQQFCHCSCCISLLAYASLETCTNTKGQADHAVCFAKAIPCCTYCTVNGVHHCSLIWSSNRSGYVVTGQGTGKHKLAVSTAVVDRLRRRLRSNGFRAHLTLQMVPEDDDLISNVHITPLRASRALALRYLANKFNLDMERVTVTSLFPVASRFSLCTS